jgi:hypothetical protein
MNYELAKSLKEAGFPQSRGGGYLSCEHGFPEGVHDVCDTFYYIPTLEELIEACGQRFYTLEYVGKLGHVWEAHFIQHDDYEIGDTPTEAVARLWLALHRPTKQELPEE